MPRPDAPQVEPSGEDQEGLWFNVSEEERQRRQRVRDALSEGGFKWEIWQKPERGMVFGMIRQDDDVQVHVRYYKGGYVKAETEIPHHYFEHLISPRESAHDIVETIFQEHGIDDVDVLEKQFPDRMKRDMPASRTPWKPVLAVAGAVLAGAIWGTKRLFGDSK